MNPNFQGAWIPRNIYLAKHLSWSEKILLVEIKELDRDERGCYAGNKHLAEHLNVTPGAAANMVSKLRQTGEIVELWSDGKNRGLRVDFERFEEVEIEHLEELEKNHQKRSEKKRKNSKLPSQNYEGSSQIYEASPQKNEGSSQNYDGSDENDTQPSQNYEDIPSDASQNYEASEGNGDSEPSYIYEHRKNKGFRFKQLEKTENTHSTRTGAGDNSPPENAVVCVDCDKSLKNGKPKKKKRRKKSDDSGSQFSLEDCLRYAELCRKNGENILNPKGLATKIFRSGEADAFIKATLYPEQRAEDFSPRREFTDEPCSVCFGAKMEIVKDLGARPCLHCWNERDQPTGKEPKGDP